MKVTPAQSAPSLSRANLHSIVEIVRETQGTSDLIVFAELALNGYLLQDKLYEDAWDIEELDIFKELSLKIDIAFGVALRDGNLFRNTALYFSQGKLLHKHHKVHLPNYGMFEEARYFKAGNGFESFMTAFGKVSMLVCEDLWHESAHIVLEKENPELILALVASPARGFTEQGLDIQKQWMDIISKAASRSHAKLIFVNRVGFEDGLGFWGGSCILDENGQVIEKLAHYKEIVQTIQI